jgi:hypothetical protein
VNAMLAALVAGGHRAGWLILDNRGFKGQNNQMNAQTNNGRFMKAK